MRGVDKKPAKSKVVQIEDELLHADRFMTDYVCIQLGCSPDLLSRAAKMISRLKDALRKDEI